MTKVFDDYARYYDLLYQDKDYASEAEYVVSFLRKLNPTATRILELGCGTGGHAVQLAAMGYTVHGIDLSQSMIAAAEARKAGLHQETAARLSFAPGDIRNVRTGEQYDAVISLFHVMSYQTNNADLDATFATAFGHLAPGGAFLFDFWYGPAVLTDRPEVRVKRLENDHIGVTRIAEPKLNVNDSTVDVNYTLFIQNKESGQIQQVTECHRLRYLFLPELQHYHAGRFTHSNSVEWMTDKPLNDRTWSAFHYALRA